MNLLLDTNALIWAISGPDRLRAEARKAITEGRNQVLVSASSVWEIVIKVRLGKLSLPSPVSDWLPTALEDKRFAPLPITMEHALAVERLPPHHSDPFDRILIAQALTEGLVIITGDRAFSRYGVQIIET